MRQLKRSLLRTGGLTAPTSAPTLICLEGSSHSKHQTRPQGTARHFHSSRKCLGRGMGAKPGQSLRPRGSQAKLERCGAERRGQDCCWLRRRGESRPPSRDVRVGSRRVLRGHNSFLQTGNTVKHKTQTKKEREREQREKESKGGGSRERQGGKDSCSYRHLPSTSCPHRSLPVSHFSAAPPRCQSRKGFKTRPGLFCVALPPLPCCWKREQQSSACVRYA